jgi:uncharacterized RDD family membrane protein YckC
MSSLQIQTTQNVALEFTPASVGDRILGTIIDFLVMIAWGIFNGILSGTLNLDIGYVWGIVIIMIPLSLYSLVSEIFLNGRTLGKMAVGTRVVRLDGTPPNIGNYLMRWMLRLIDIWIGSGVVAVITTAVNGKGQRLGDIAAGTAVVKQRPPVSLKQVATVKIEENYQVTFPEANALTDHEIGILKATLRNNIQGGNSTLVWQAADKIKDVLGITSALDDVTFLKTVIKDHTYLATLE